MERTGCRRWKARRPRSSFIDNNSLPGRHNCGRGRRNARVGGIVMGRWLGVLLIALPMVCATAPVFAQDQAAKAEWKEYPYPDDGFALTAPSQPMLQKQQQATAAGNVEMRQYSVDLGNNAGVLMSVSDFPNTADSDPEKILESAVNGSIQ